MNLIFSAFQRLRREIEVWARLKHDRILQLHGLTFDCGLYAAMVCPWLQNGDLNGYLKSRGDVLPMSGRLQIVSGLEPKF